MKKSSSARKFIAIFMCLIMVLPLSACGEGKMIQNQVYAMNNIITVTAYGNSAEKGISSALSTIMALDALVDPNQKTSSTYALNNAQGETVVVTGMIAEMLLKAKDVYEKSGGSYDPTIDPLVSRWGFNDGKYYTPTDEEIMLDLSLLCMDQIAIDKYPNSGSYTVTLPSFGSLSFASCARGCASQFAIDAMRKQGVSSAIVSSTGNVQTLGVKPDGSNWTVGITDPNDPSTYLGTVSVGETAIITSGGYSRTMPSNPKYHHILNPKSGYPTSNGVVSVTVLCEDGTTADCLSTAMVVLGKSGAIKYWQTNGGFEMIIITDDNKITCTSGLIEKFDLKNRNYTLNFVE